MTKKFLSYLCIGCIWGFTSISASASVSEGFISTSLPTLYMDFIANASCTLYIDTDGWATVETTLNGYQGITTKTTIDACLQQYKNDKWVTIKSFSQVTGEHRVSLSEETRISKNYSYRAKATVRAYSGSSTETQVLTSSEATY